MTIKYCEHGYPVSNATCPSCELAAKDAEIERLKAWKDAIVEAGVVSWTLNVENEDDPKKAINDLLCYVQKLTLDPSVSSDAAALHDRIADLERENAELKKNLEHCASAANDPESCAALAIENAELRKDAERYRWLRRKEIPASVDLYEYHGAGSYELKSEDRLDSEIDAAMANGL